MKFPTFCTIVVSGLTALAAQGQVVISGYMANPASTDSPYEYVQLVAVQNINFAATPMSVVFANSSSTTPGTALGWTQGGLTTYGLTLTSGTVSAGQVFYVGGNGETINGSGSTSLAGQTWIRAVNTGTANGDLFGTAASGGVVGNGGSHADGIAVFNTTSLTASTAPIDSIFYGTAVGTTFVTATTGYTVAANDLYSGGVLQSNSTLMPDPAGSQYTQLTGTYDPNTGTWTSPRTGALLTLTATSLVSAINSQITVAVPEPTTVAMIGLGLASILGFRRKSKA